MGKIIWLASYPKSGNTWVRAFLLDLLRGRTHPFDVNRVAEFCLTDSAAGWYAPFIGRTPGDWSIEEVGRVRSQAHERMAASASQSAVLMKTHNAIVQDRFGPVIPKNLTAAAIYILRNPLDVAISYSHHLGKSIDETIDLMNNPGAGTPNTPNNVYQLLRTWSEHVESWTARPATPLHQVRYEDLLSDPERGFRAIAAFLGAKPSRERLLHAIQNCRFDELRRSEEQQGYKERSRFAERFFREGKAGQWQTILTPAQVERIAGAHAAQMRRFGYLPRK
jgi:hypothetical protein